ncbi:LysR family transcriptional regulator [Sphingobium jiangsuense]|nr:LysR family transcriptional regulator [Sphingobium jiangsuense]GLS98626.1 LysR family transcriptional regulator [Sphingobium jiangsuense]
MDRMTALEVFVAVAETGSFTRAAVRMRISTAMATLHIRRLEEHMGVGLFNRTTRRVDLTEDGRQFLDHARGVLDAFATAERAMRPGAGLSGRVRLDAPASMGHAFIVPALADFHRLHPNITLDLSLGDRGTFFRIDGFDIVLRAGEVPASGWRTIPLGMTRLIFLAAPAYIERHGLPADPDGLKHHRCILYASTETPGGNPWTLIHHGRRMKLRPPAAFTFNDGAAIMTATRAGLGIAQNLEMLARDDLQSGRLVQVMPEFGVAELAVVLMSAQERMALPHVRAVLDFLSSRIDWALDRR